MHWLDEMIAEFKRQPYTLVASLLTIALFVWDRAFVGFVLQGSPATSEQGLPQQINVEPDLMFIGKTCAIILAQGAVASIASVIQSAICQAQHNFRVILLLVLCAIVAWLVAFNSFWFTHFGHNGLDVYVYVIVLSWLVVAGFSLAAFSHDYDRFEAKNLGAEAWLIPFFVIFPSDFVFGIVMGRYFASHLA
jgi:hypothetical protein